MLSIQAMKQVGILSDEKKVPKELQKLDKGIKKMKQSDLIVKLVREIQKEGVIGEEDTILALMLKVTLRLVKNSTPTSSNVLVSDESGGGKDWTTKCICMTMLKHTEYFHRSRLTEKAFTYWNTKKKDFTWDRKVIHLEDPDAEFLNSQAFKVRASGETEETIVKDQKAIDIKVKGKPVIIVTSLTASINTEGVRRWDNCRINTSDELTKEIIKFNMLKEAGLIKVEKDEELREAVQNLQPKDVIIPYASALLQVLPNTLGMRTQHHKLMDYIKASAVLHQHQRNKTEDGKLIANIFDYEYARFCFYKFGNMKGVPLNIAEEQLIDVLLQNDHPMTIRQVLPHLNRGQRWLYDKIDRLKELNCIKELFIYDEQSKKEVKHLIANEKMAWRSLLDGVEILKIYKQQEKKIKSHISSPRFAFSKIDLSNGRKIADFEWGFAEFQENVYILLKDSIINNNIIYNTYIHKNAKHTIQQEKGQIAEPMQNMRNTPVTEGRTKNEQLDVGVKPLSEKINELREFIRYNKKSGYKITKDILDNEFGENFVDKCIEKDILIKTGNEYVCN